MTTPWSPEQYLRFERERTRPSIDLAAAVRLDSPTSVVDLGCGSGNSTAVLRQRWPAARVAGLDSSEAMLERARAEYPAGPWILSTIEAWHPREPFNVVFSNATLHWVSDHGPLVERLLAAVARGGALAFQLPSSTPPLMRVLMHETARSGPWANRMLAALAATTREPPTFYYDRLAPLARAVDLWETEYLHVLENHAAIVAWMSSTGLRPFLQALDSEADHERFLAHLLDRVTKSYEVRSDGKILYPFRRTFVVAYR